MYRDFSDTSKQRLLELVDQVENEKWNDFTDWVGDRWLDFQSWIGKLNIKNYINDVNEYHKKVIDKNNTSKAAIERIFFKVNSVDVIFYGNTISIKNSLINWEIYMREMSQIVSSSKGFAVVNIENSLGGILQTCVEETTALNAAQEGKTKWEVFLEKLNSKYGWNEILQGSGYVGDIYRFIQDIQEGKSWIDFAKTGVKVYEFLSGAAKTYNNYMKIGRAVGKSTATWWWAKNITGLKPLGRASVAKNPFTRFANNLTNKTSPFHAQLVNIKNNFTGANGIGKAFASWTGVAITGISNWFSNKEEQLESNGTMSDARVVAETVSETVVGTALSYGAGAVVGAAVTTVLGTAAAPGVLVVALSGLAIAGINAGIEALTGKSATEWISDAILNAGEAVGKAVVAAGKVIGKAVYNVGQKAYNVGKAVVKGVADTGKKIGNAIADAGQAIGQAVVNAGEAIGNAIGDAAVNVKNAVGNWFRNPLFIH